MFNVIPKLKIWGSVLWLVEIYVAGYDKDDAQEELIKVLISFLTSCQCP